MSKYYAIGISLPKATSHHPQHDTICFLSNCFNYTILHRCGKSVDIFTLGNEAVLMRKDCGFTRGIDARQVVDMKTVWQMPASRDGLWNNQVIPVAGR